MSTRRKFVAAGAAALAVAAGGTGLALAGGSGDDTGEGEAPITGTALDQAEKAAIEHVGEGEVTETETGDEESYYEVEVTLDDGSQTDVQLDRDFEVVSAEADDESEAGDDD